ncbi:flavin reductase family protein [Psychromicrobium lacuslunae]|uniref:flavin reductase family protein n=1 Tax=Psychromicrobium lacuslunae TaxID=1618207 RepID=UPI0005D33A1C|nr:flavin reductase family protein [Psychromicrobium lacuslunae]
MGFPDQVTPQQMRTVLGHFATGLTVVTALDSSGPVGFTCQSFTSLSLEPPLISINPTKGSSSWPKIRQVGHFAVNILPTGAEQLALSFSRRGIDRFEGIEWRPSAAENPHLTGALAWVDCELEAEHDAGDHTIAIARVRQLSASDTVQQPLLFFRGDFAALHNEPAVSPLRQRSEVLGDSRASALSA